MVKHGLKAKFRALMYSFPKATRSILTVGSWMYSLSLHEGPQGSFDFSQVESGLT